MQKEFGQALQGGALCMFLFEVANVATGGALSLPLLAADFAFAAVGKAIENNAAPSPAAA